MNFLNPNGLNSLYNLLASLYLFSNHFYKLVKKLATSFSRAPFNKEIKKQCISWCHRKELVIILGEKELVQIGVVPDSYAGVKGNTL